MSRQFLMFLFLFIIYLDLAFSLFLCIHVRAIFTYSNILCCKKMSTKQRKEEIVLPTSGRKMQEITTIVRSSLHRHLLPQQNRTICRHVLLSTGQSIGMGEKLINLFVAAPVSHTNLKTFWIMKWIFARGLMAFGIRIKSIECGYSFRFTDSNSAKLIIPWNVFIMLRAIVIASS